MHSVRKILVGFFILLAMVGTSRGSSTNQLVTTVAQIEHARILRLASNALALTPPSITYQRATNSFGGLHDYYSQADYYWPNDRTKTGLPYVNRDGYSNPNTFQYHRLALRGMKDAVAALTAAYAITGDDAYVLKAQELLRVFFLDPSTRMNPNAQYAQAILGASRGSPLGIIDTLHLAEVATAIRFLEKSPAFDPAVDAGLKQWFGDYIRWLRTSGNGKKEMNQSNNHSIAYALQLACFARLVGDQTNFNFARQRFETILIPRQMATNGSFSRELKRTKPYSYSVFQAENVATLCQLFSTPQNDVWTFAMPKHAAAVRSTEFIYPYLADKQKWLDDGHPMDVMHWESWPVRESCLLFAYIETGRQAYFDLWKQLDPDPADLEVRRNIPITQPILWIARPEEIPLLTE
jgi:hypothetical protein